MGRQINFFLHPDDNKDFEVLLKSFGDIVFLPYYHHDNKVSTIEDTQIHDIVKEGTRVYLVRPEDIKDVKLTYIAKFNYWLVEDTGSPVLHFDRCTFNENKIQRGRLYFHPQSVKDMTWLKKSDDFVNWADNIIKTVRRKLKKHKHEMGSYSYTEFLGPKALDWLNTNNAVVVFGGQELESSTQ